MQLRCELFTALYHGYVCNFAVLMYPLFILQEFFEKNPAPAANRAIQQSCENIELNAAMLERDRESMKSFLSEATSQ